MKRAVAVRDLLLVVVDFGNPCIMTDTEGERLVLSTTGEGGEIVVTAVEVGE